MFCGGAKVPPAAVPDDEHDELARTRLPTSHEVGPRGEIALEDCIGARGSALITGRFVLETARLLRQNWHQGVSPMRSLTFSSVLPAWPGRRPRPQPAAVAPAWSPFPPPPAPLAMRPHHHDGAFVTENDFKGGIHAVMGGHCGGDVRL